MYTSHKMHIVYDIPNACSNHTTFKVHQTRIFKNQEKKREKNTTASLASNEGNVLKPTMNQ